MRHHACRPQPCHDGKVPDPMTTVVAARNAYVAARERVTETRLALGKVIKEARAEGVQQEAIARELVLTREQVRRYQAEYEKWLARQS